MAKAKVQTEEEVGSVNLLAYPSELVEVDIKSLNLIKDHNSILFQKRVNNPVNKDMVKSLKEHGQIQNIVIVPTLEGKEGTFDVVAGRQRVINAPEAGLTSLTAKLYHIPATDELALKELMIIENQQREGVSMLDTAFEILEWLNLRKDENGKLPNGTVVRGQQLFRLSKRGWFDHILLTKASDFMVKNIRNGKIAPTNAIPIIVASQLKDGTVDTEKQDKLLRKLLDKAKPKVESDGEGDGKGEGGNVTGSQVKNIKPVGLRPITKTEMATLVDYVDVPKALKPFIYFLAGKLENEEARKQVLVKFPFLSVLEEEE